MELLTVTNTEQEQYTNINDWQFTNQFKNSLMTFHR